MNEDMLHGILVGGGIVLAVVVVTAVLVAFSVSRTIRDLEACDDDHPINQGRGR